MGLPVPPTPVVKLEPNYKYPYEMKVAPTVSPKFDKSYFIKFWTNWMYLYDGR